MIRIALALFTLLGTVRADVLRVDDDGGPGIDFLSIRDAVDVANAGDRILVEPGAYGGVTVFRGVTIMGTGPGVQVYAPLTAQWIPPGEVCVLADLRVTDLDVLFCDGTVVLSGIDTFSSSDGPEQLKVNDSHDVRLERVDAEWGSQRTMRILNSRVEINGSSITGLDSWVYMGVGRPALSVFQNSRVVIARSHLHGGEGYDCSDGANAIEAGFGPVESGTHLLVLGHPLDTIDGGQGHTSFSHLDYCYGGGSGSAIHITKGSVRHSGATLTAPGNIPPIVLETAALEDPFLEIVGVPARGTMSSLIVNGPPGSKFRLFVGLTPTTEPGASIEDELLIANTRELTQGVIDASHQEVHTIQWPGNEVYQGVTVYAQAEVRTPSGARFRTNSVPMVIR